MKIISAILAVAFVFLFVSCTAEQNEEKETTTQIKATESTTDNKLNKEETTDYYEIEDDEEKEDYPDEEIAVNGEEKTNKADSTTKVHTTKKPSATKHHNILKETTTKQSPPTPQNNGIVTDEMIRQIKIRFLQLVNEEREKKGVGKLTVSTYLEAAAAIRSHEIINTWSHTRPDGSRFYTAIDENKYHFAAVGENIAMTTYIGKNTVDDTVVFKGDDNDMNRIAEYFFKLYVESPSHYQNMVDSHFKNSGIGISYIIDKKTNLPTFYMAHIFGAL